MYQQLLKFSREQSHKRQINNLPKHKTKKCNYNEDTVSVICWNIRGIGDKLDQSETLNYLMKNHIIILLETMKSPDYEINIAILHISIFREMKSILKHADFLVDLAY